MGALKCDPGPTYARTTFRVSELLLPEGAERGVFGSALQRLATNSFGSFTFVARPMQLHAVALAAFASLVAPFGGFFASGLKRSLKVKDFGHSIPGHGGMTDRMDCQVVMAVFSYLYYHACVSAEDDFGSGSSSGRNKKAASAAALAAAAAALPAVERLRLAALLVAGVASGNTSATGGASPLSGIASVLEAAAAEEAASGAVVTAARVLEEKCNEKKSRVEKNKVFAQKRSRRRFSFFFLFFFIFSSLSFSHSIMAAPSTSPALLYRQTALGDALVESLDALITAGKIAPDLALKVLAEVRRD